MKTLWFAVAMTVTLVSCNEPTGSNPGQFSSFEQSLEDQLIDYVSRFDEIPGAWLSVDLENGELVELSAGLADIPSAQELEPDRPFRIASISKLMTSTVVMQLMEEGQINLTDSISTYLNSDLLDGIQIGESTITNLLQHTSGIDDYVQLRWVETLQENPARFWSPESLVEHVRNNGSPQFAPNDGYFYSDTNYLLLGLIIERVTEQSLHEAYASRIFQPLKMNNTFLEAYNLPADYLLSSGYFETADLTDWNTSSDWGGGGLVSTVEDLSIFMRSLMAGSLFLNASTLQDMTNWQRINDRSEYALGIGRYDIGGTLVIGHGGQGFGFTSGLYYYPEKNAVIVLAVNQQATSIDGFEEAVVETINRFY